MFQGLRRATGPLQFLCEIVVHLRIVGPLLHGHLAQAQIPLHLSPAVLHGGGVTQVQQFRAPAQPGGMRLSPIAKQCFMHPPGIP